MNREKYQQVKQIFQTAIELEPNERIAFLDDACRDESLRRDVDILLDSFESQFLEKPVIGKIEETFSENKLAAGRKINQYEIREKLGAGGMGEVYLAQDMRLNRLVAIKFLLPVANLDAKAEKRLLREAQSVAALDHPNICTVYEVGEFEGRSFIVMQYVEGETLDARIKRQPLTINESLTVAANVADALTEAHSRGIIHRDIKPSNIIISSRGQIKVLDFSLAKKIVFQGEAATESALSQAGVIAGTVAYMSPEQARGQEIDERSDIWSLGVVLYEMLTGCLPFKGETKSDTLAAILLAEFVSAKKIVPNLPPEIDRIINKSLQKNRDERFASSQEFLSGLNVIQAKTKSQTTDENVSKVSLTGNINSQTDDLHDYVSRNEINNNLLTYSQTLRKTKGLATTSGFSNLFERFRAIRLLILLLLGFVIIGLAGRTFIYFYPSAKITRAFSESSREKLQITSLYSAKRKPNGAITDVSFSPDGKLIAFLLSGEGISDIYVKQSVQGEPIKITDGKWNIQTPVWSPDTQRIAFVANRGGDYGIWTTSYLGGTPVLLMHLEQTPVSHQLKKWSKDGKRFYIEQNGELMTIDLETGQTAKIQLPEENVVGSFSISEDEKMITYIVIENSKEKVWVQSLETGEARAVSKNNFANWYPAFFPDNKRIAYSSNQNGNFQIYISDLSGKETTQLTFGDSNANNPKISPDGKKIIYVSELDEANIFSFDLKSGKETQQTSNTKMQLFPDISPSSEKMVFQVTDEAAKIYTSPLKIKTLNTGTEPNQIVEFGGWAKWSPTNPEIAFLKFSGTNVNIWKISVADQKEKQLTTTGIVMDQNSISPYNLKAIPFSWSPDGSRIVYSVRESDVYNLWTIDRHGANPQMLTNNKEKDLKYSSPFWSPDSSKIAFIYREKDKNNNFRFGVSVVENGRTANIFESGSQIRILGWTKDNSGVIAAVNNQDAVDLILISTTTVPRHSAKLKGANLDGLSLAPDSEKAAFSARRNGIDNIFIYSFDGKETKITSNLENTLYYSGITWSPDGNNLFYSKQTGGMQITMISDLD